ncbi:hypothetical protein N665_0404s0004 [Sinapis alba]|nr:hypothetical protein N665_0404s0004 [Sinapis alba]
MILPPVLAVMVVEDSPTSFGSNGGGRMSFRYYLYPSLLQFFFLVGSQQISFPREFAFSVII